MLMQACMPRVGNIIQASHVCDRESLNPLLSVGTCISRKTDQEPEQDIRARHYAVGHECTKQHLTINPNTCLNNLNLKCKMSFFSGFFWSVFKIFVSFASDSFTVPKV